MKFMEDHGSKFDKAVMLQENKESEIHRVQIGGNLLWDLDLSGNILHRRTTLAFKSLLFSHWLQGLGSGCKSTGCATRTRILQPFKCWSWKMLELDKYLTLTLMSVEGRIVFQMN